MNFSTVIRKISRPKKEIRYLESVKLTNNSLLEGRNILILGGSGGIGKAIALSAQESGAHVVVASRNPNKDDQDIFEYEKWDLNDIAGINQRFEHIAKKYSIDTVVNSQGLLPENDRMQDFFKINQGGYEDAFRLNAESVFFVCQAASAYFIEHKIEGNILNIASTDGIRDSFTPYGLSKHAVVSLTRGLGKFLSSYNVNVVGIAPGGTATSMIGKSLDSDLSSPIPSGRFTIPEEIANLAIFLLSDAGRQMCGQVVVIDGGESLH